MGDINKNTTQAELDIMFEKDSIVKLPENGTLFNKYKIYNKSGDQLLTIKFAIKRDSIKGVDNIKIFDKTYKTKKGISTASTFKDVLDQYSINKVEPFIASVIISIDELNASIALDKKELKINEFDMRKVSKDQIPDMAKIQYITLWFD